MNPISKLHSMGQSIWYDNIQRGLLESGELARMIARNGIRGVTSNPSIFQNAIAMSGDYEDALKTMAWAGWGAPEIFYQLAFEDIRAAADLFLPLYHETKGGDGYVSMEVSPFLAKDTEGTVKEARRLWQAVDRPNLMVKIPATAEGIPAICQAIADGINVNVTLIFSLARYAQVIDAYMQGLEQRVSQGMPVSGIASVASFFVSRLDTKVDAQLQKIIREEGANAKEATRLQGKAAIGNAKLAYQQFKNCFSDNRFQKLLHKGAQVQRPLWASTSAKNPAYRDVLYVEELIGPQTVDTVPPQTLIAFQDHGNPRLSLEEDLIQARQDIEALTRLGISLEKATQELEVEGVKAFSDAFGALLKTIEGRKASAADELGPLKESVPSRVQILDQQKTIQRLYAADASLWTMDNEGQEEIKHRLGWLNLPAPHDPILKSLEDFRLELIGAGFTHVLLLGMGGSSLAPEVMGTIFGVKKGDGGHDQGLDLAILDSTDPDQVRLAARRSAINHTLYIVSSKSGSTSEIMAFFNYFWQRASRKLGNKTGEHFIAITDPGTSLEKLAQERGFRRIFNANPLVGGRYSALTAFGLVPATLVGVDLEKFLGSAERLSRQMVESVPTGRNIGAVLGAILGQAALEGRDKLTFISDPEIASFGTWLEQLVAESSGKVGKGIVPIEGEPIINSKGYRPDRLFVYLRLMGQFDEHARQLRRDGQPVITLQFKDTFDLGAEFFLWEFATAIACSILMVNGFDQPDVQDSKSRTQKKIAVYQKTRVFETPAVIWEGKAAMVFGAANERIEKQETLPKIVRTFLALANPGDYVAINAYLPRNLHNIARLRKLRTTIYKLTGLATMVGFGPRFLHSTGQLHKGGANNGMFIQITHDSKNDISIPGQNLTFGVLERAQSLGDMEALIAHGRRTLWIHLHDKGLDKIL